jgi:hypothetical protein
MARPIICAVRASAYIATSAMDAPPTVAFQSGMGRAIKLPTANMRFGVRIICPRAPAGSGEIFSAQELKLS